MTAAAAGPGGCGGRAAFFDVDETLIGIKSMFDFLEFYLERRGEPPATYRRLAAELHAMAAAGRPRREVNRQYYRFYAGHSASGLARLGREWFGRRLAAGGLFTAEPAARLAAHVRGGDFVMLLSGSFSACLDPIADHLGAHAALGTRPLIRGGDLTGEVLTPMIGPVKGRAARAAMAVGGLDPAVCAAYGDHSSDLDLLRSVARPVVVGDDPVLAEYVNRDGWERISAEPLTGELPAAAAITARYEAGAVADVPAQAAPVSLEA
ncbi:HAD family hydrolase [Streptomyces sp. NBC_01190]|uniref:HAD family hydrolase n=1 Tax=Streptomyces sp. NBC_01190 TaxID=2903767 RepID=UPI0038673A72|nr:HAD-IB family hydrolase [Streptomyces sp. NBC_01190]